MSKTVMTKEDREICIQNLKLVDYIIHNKLHIHTNSWFYDDLQQEGRLALCSAILKFDPNKGYKLSTYATSYIYFTLLKWLRESLPLYRIPRTVLDKRTVITKIKEDNPEITAEELAELTGYSLYDIREAAVGYNYLSLDEIVSDNKDNFNVWGGNP